MTCLTYNIAVTFKKVNCRHALHDNGQRRDVAVTHIIYLEYYVVDYYTVSTTLLCGFQIRMFPSTVVVPTISLPMGASA